MPYEIKNPNSAAPAETISDEQHATLRAGNRLRNYEVKEVVKVAKPAELAPEADKKHKAEADKK